MRTEIPNILAAFDSAIWGITPQKYHAIREFLMDRAAGGSSEKFQAGPRPTPRVAGRIAVLPLNGVIAHHAGIEMDISGGTSTDAFGRGFDEAVANADVGAIVIDCDSPGGTVEGVPECAARIYNARGKKPIYAIANANMNSAAYWIASAADQVIATPSANVGSIGVFTIHTDTSAMESKAGLKRTVIASGRFKGEAAPGVPLTDDAAAALEARVEECYVMFAGAVAKHRGTTLAKVRDGFGEGRSLSAQQALAAGLVDRIATIEDVLGELSGSQASGRPARRMAAIKRVTIAGGLTPALLAADLGPGRIEFVAFDGPGDCPDCGTALVEEDGEYVCPTCSPEEAAPSDPPEASARRGATPAVPVAPAPTEPAPQARSHTMTAEELAAQRAAMETEVRKAETTRQTEIRALCAENKIADDVLDRFLSSGASVDAASREILQAKRKETEKKPTIRNGTGMSVRSVRDRVEDDPRRGFATHRDFLMAVMANRGRADISQVKDERLRHVAVRDGDDDQSGGEVAYVLPRAFTPGSMMAAAGSDEQSTFSDPYGGFSVVSARLPQLLEVGAEGDPSAGRTQDIPMAAPTVEIEARTDKNHTTSVSGGFVWSRNPEAVSKTSSRGQFDLVTMKATGLFGLAYATEELLTDSPLSFAAIIESGFRTQLGPHMLNEKLRGKGGSEFFGVLNALAASNLGPTISIAKEAGQTTKTIVTANLLKARARSWGYGQSIWIANHDTFPQLAVLSIGLGTAGALVYQQSMVEDRPDMLLGRPIFYSEYMGTVGAQGDIGLFNWSQYLEGTYQPLQSAESIHVRFVNHERTFKFWVRNAGQPWWKTALTPNQSADTLSPFVVLDAR